MKLKKARLILLSCFVFTAITAGVLTAKQNIPTSVNVRGKIASAVDVGVYSNPEATITCTNVDCPLTKKTRLS